MGEKKQLKLISWNVNGLRAVLKKDFFDSVTGMDPDILMLQETKLQEDQRTDEMTRFSPYEAHGIKQFLKMGDKPGLEGLKKALNFRMYSLINKQSIVDEGPQSFIFQMNECRVQAARKRKNLDDYPCKTAGLVEYRYFASAIDSRIETECIGCPPDPHPETWFCAWRFTLPQ